MLQGLSWAGYLVTRVALIATIFEYCNDLQIVQYHTRNMSDYLFKGIFIISHHSLVFTPSPITAVFLGRRAYTLYIFKNDAIFLTSILEIVPC